MSHRTEQIASMLRRVVSQVLARDISDPRVVGMVSVTKVSVSPDLRHADVHVSVLPQEYEARTLGGLNNAAPHIYQRVCRAVAMRQVPHLHFRLDSSLKKQAEIFDAIRSAQAKDDAIRPDQTPDQEPPSSGQAPDQEPSA
jgi:ribosome-binding factor A